MPRPKPANPKYGRVLIPCIFFISDPKDGGMVPVGILKRESLVILHKTDGAWADVQLESGHMGSVLSQNVGSLATGATPHPRPSGDEPALDPLPTTPTPAGNAAATLLDAPLTSN